MKILAAIPALFLLGCAAIDKSADPFVVNAERTAEHALATFDTFLQWERDNRAILNNPDIKKAADEIRLYGKHWIADLRLATQTYKQSRTDANADLVTRRLRLVQTGLDIARKYIKPTP